MTSLIERGYYFDERIAEKAVERMSRYRYEGRDGWLADFWADGMIRPLYGWRRADGSRRFRRFIASTARKNAKSFVVALVCTDLAYFDDDRWPEIVLAASDVDEADRVYAVVEGIILETPVLNQYARVTASRKRIDILLADKTGATTRKGSIRVVSSRPKHGFNPSVVVMDELHKWPQDRRLFNALNTGRGARLCPLRLIISTMPEDSGGTSLMDEQVDRALAIEDGTIDDPTTGSFLCIPGADSDPHDEATWYAGNPGLGTVKSLETMREDYREARDIPAMFATWRQLELNQRVDRQEAAISAEEWAACEADYEIEDGASCYLGLDLSSTRDITALVAVFPQPDDDWWTLEWLFTPRETMAAREKVDQIPYSSWVREGHMIATPGRAINYAAIREVLREIRSRWSVAHLSADPWNAAQFLQELQQPADPKESPWPVTELRQGFQSMNAPAKELLRRISERQIKHRRNPAVGWQRANLLLLKDARGNVKPGKRRDREKIDYWSALINATDAAMRLAPVAKKKSIYNSRAPLVLTAG